MTTLRNGVLPDNHTENLVFGQMTTLRIGVYPDPDLYEFKDI